MVTCDFPTERGKKTSLGVLFFTQTLFLRANLAQGRSTEWVWWTGTRVRRIKTDEYSDQTRLFPKAAAVEQMQTPCKTPKYSVLYYLVYLEEV